VSLHLNLLVPFFPRLAALLSPFAPSEIGIVVKFEDFHTATFALPRSLEVYPLGALFSKGILATSRVMDFASLQDAV